MTLKSLLLLVSIDLGLLALMVTLRFIIFPLIMCWQERRLEYPNSLIEIKVEGVQI